MAKQQITHQPSGKETSMKFNQICKDLSTQQELNKVWMVKEEAKKADPALLNRIQGQTKSKSWNTPEKCSSWTFGYQKY